MKVGGGIGTAAVGWLLKLGGFVGTATVQSESLSLIHISNAFCEFFLPQPVDALPDDAQQRKILKNSVQRVEVIPAPEGFGVVLSLIHI